MTLDDYDMVTVVSEQQQRNAYAVAAWRLQYQRQAQCPDPRTFELKCRGALLAERMQEARAYVERRRAERQAAERDAAERREHEARRDRASGLCRVIVFPSRSRVTWRD